MQGARSAGRFDWDGRGGADVVGSDPEEQSHYGTDGHPEPLVGADSGERRGIVVDQRGAEREACATLSASTS